MATADEYRQFAEECLRWARDAKPDEERKAFLDMARAWTQAAAKTNGEAATIGIVQRPGEADLKGSR
jgi:hypothetical protein